MDICLPEYIYIYILMVFSLELKHRHDMNKCALAPGRISTGREMLFGAAELYPGTLIQ